MDAVTLALAKKHTNEQVIQKATNSPTETISFDNGIYSVGNNVVNGQVSDVVLKGVTLNQLANNGANYAKWWVSGAGTTKGANGIKIVEDDSNDVALLNTHLTGSTEYTICYTITESNLDAAGILYLANRLTGVNVALNKTVGKHKIKITTQATITENQLRLYLFNNANGKYVQITDIMIFEGDQTANQSITHYLSYGTNSTNSVRIRSVNEDETKESIAYVNLPQGEELRSLPNGANDEVNVTTGVKTQNVSEDTLVSDTVYASLDTSTYTNVDVIKTTAFSLAKAGTTGADGQTHYYNKDGVELAEVAEADIDLEASAGKYYWGEDKKLYIIVAKGDYADIAAARTGLGTTSLTYQLAEPVVTKLPAQAPLQVFENGTVYVEPIGDPAESTVPSVEMTIPTGNSNKFGVASHDYEGAAADWVLTNSESKCFMLAVSNAGGAANIIAPDAPGVMYAISNASEQTVTVKISGGTGVAITNAKTVLVIHNGTDYTALTAEL